MINTRIHLIKLVFLRRTAFIVPSKQNTNTKRKDPGITVTNDFIYM